MSEAPVIRVQYSHPRLPRSLTLGVHSYVGDGVVQYQITGQRGTPSSTFAVFFCSVPGGGSVVTQQFSEAV